MSKEKTIVTGDLVQADFVSNKPRKKIKALDSGEIVKAGLKALAKKKAAKNDSKG